MLVLQRLRNGVAGLSLGADAGEHAFTLADPAGRLRLAAALFPDDRGTTIEATLQPGDAMATIDGFSAEVAAAAGALFALLEGELEGQAVVADPASDGAAGAAPASLRATTSGPDEACFVLQAPWIFGMLGPSAPATEIGVGPAGITCGGGRRPRSWPWGRIGGAAIARGQDRTHLVLLDVAGDVLIGLPCAGSADDEWLAAYVDARARARHPSPGERADHDGTRTRLDDLLGMRRPKA